MLQKPSKSTPARAARDRTRRIDTGIDGGAVRSWLSVVTVYHLCDALMARRGAEAMQRVGARLKAQLDG